MGSDPRLSLAMRLCRASMGSLPGLYRLLEACLVGFWLGILRRDTLHRMDEIVYNNARPYFGEDWNRGGLFPWERQAVESHFQGARRLLVGGAGGGRELLALCQLGYEVEGFECNPRLAAFADQLLEGEGLAARVHLVARDRCWVGDSGYDGLIVGWAAYTLIQGRRQRIACLKELRAQVGEGAPLLLSFYHRSGSDRRFRWTAAIGNLLRRLLGREPLEVGDHLATHPPHHFVNYVHYFTRQQIASELREAGFALAHYSTRGYGHAVGRAVRLSGALPTASDRRHSPAETRSLIAGSPR